MHPVLPAELGSWTSLSHYPMIRMLVSPRALGINMEGEVLNYQGSVWDGFIPADRRGIKAFKPTVERILGYDPLVSATINADLDNPVQDATITLNLGRSDITPKTNLSPYMSGPSWDWSLYDPINWHRPLFDPGIYVQLEAKIISPDPRQVPQAPPDFIDKGPMVATSGAVDVAPFWPPHIADDIGLLIVETAAQAATLSTAAGFVEVPGSPQTTGTAGGTASTRLQVYWCRASSSNSASPVLANPGDHILAQIYVFRGCIATGVPWDVTPIGSVQATANASFVTPTLTLTSQNNLVVGIVAIATDTSTKQVKTETGVAPVMAGNTGQPNTPMTINGNFARTAGNGGGIGVVSAVKIPGGSIGAAAPTGGLLTASVQAKLTIALKPLAPGVTSDNPTNVEWHPFFTGRIDSAEPGGTSDHLVLRCRDMYADALDSWLAAPHTMEPDNIQDLLGNLFGLRAKPIEAPENTGLVFATVGSPEMVVPTYTQQPGSVLLVMREAGLQNGWDLRGRYGTAPFLPDQFVLTYYEPDRDLEGFPLTLVPWTYFEIPSMGKDRDEVRNDVRVTPSDLPRTPQQASNENSQIKYGYRLLAITEDVTSLIATADQASLLAASILSDTMEPKVEAEVSIRFMPWIEINDVVKITANNVQHDTDMLVAVSGYTHTLAAAQNPGDNITAKTVLRTRGRPAAASREWRRTNPKMLYVSPSDPDGPAAEGALWLTRRD